MDRAGAAGDGGGDDQAASFTCRAGGVASDRDGAVPKSVDSRHRQQAGPGSASRVADGRPERRARQRQANKNTGKKFYYDWGEPPFRVKRLHDFFLSAYGLLPY